MRRKQIRLTESVEFLNKDGLYKGKISRTGRPDQHRVYLRFELDGQYLGYMENKKTMRKLRRLINEALGESEREK